MPIVASIGNAEEMKNAGDNNAPFDAILLIIHTPIGIAFMHLPAINQ